MTRTNAIQIIKILALVVLFSYILDKVVFLSLNQVSDKVMTGQAVGKLNHFLAIKDTTNIIAFGNSRTNRHIDVNLVSKSTYNMGIDGIDIGYFATLIKTLPTKKKQLIIIHLDTKNMFGDDYKGTDIRALKTKYKRHPAITNALTTSNYIGPIQKIYWSINYNGRVFGILKNYFKPKYDVTHYKGYDPITLSENQKAIRDKLLSETNSNACFDDYKANSIALKHLKSMIKFCDENNKILIAITSPLYNDHCIKDNRQLEILTNELGLSYWDFTNLFKSDQSKELWKDKTHLSKAGAEVFTKILIDKLKINSYSIN